MIKKELYKEIEELKKLKDDMTKQLVDAWDKEYSRNLKDEQRKKYIVDLCKSVYAPKIDVEYIGDPKDRRVRVAIESSCDDINCGCTICQVLNKTQKEN